MTEARVVYPNAKFTKSKGNVTVTPSQTEATYSEVGVLNTEPSAGSQQQAVSAGGSKVTAERVATVVLLAAAVIAFGFTRYEHHQITEHLQKLTDENAALRRNITERRCEVKTLQKPCPEPPTDPCQKCEDGWEENRSRCYYFSTDKSTWEQARDECRGRGGDLVKIDSEAEQSFLMQKLKDKMVENEDKFWIGLTDSEEEGTWLWADGTRLNESLQFWNSIEPDNWTEKDTDGEDCVRMGELRGSHRMCWFDQSCKASQKRICEKPAETGRLEKVCILV